MQHDGAKEGGEVKRFMVCLEDTRNDDDGERGEGGGRRMAQVGSTGSWPFLYHLIGCWDINHERGRQWSPGWDSV